MPLLLEAIMPPAELKRAFKEGTSTDFQKPGELDAEIIDKYYPVVKGQYIRE